MSKRSEKDVESPQSPQIKRKKRTAVIPANSVSSNILIACTIMEWQAEYLQPPIFQPFKDDVSLSRAITAQLREFNESKPKPCKYKKIYDR